ncbi:endonuclease MutS2 isoform X2 [Phoenix dactylifera]|uniref:Endonuclease MutS2 isoform X2 n=1 Tax=Phoenix dactylifera TaxID=42345 RepID=A0A8B8ZUL9_PHODC|nr:endonuclease MutS2 isoform X2 [Phoenix dactylifera]
MFLFSLDSRSVPIFATAVAFPDRRASHLHPRASLLPIQVGSAGRPPKSAAISDSLRLLEWDKVCDSVSSFAGTALGREATKAQLWSVDVSYEESKKLLDETSAAIELIKYGAGGMDFACIDTNLVKSAIHRASRGSLLDGREAIAVLSLILFAENLQITLKTAVKENANWYNRFMPLSEMIMDVAISRSFAKLVQQVIDEDGSVKDSASPELKRSRDQVRALERKLYQLLVELIRNNDNEESTLEVCVVNGRCCLKVMADQLTTFNGLLLSSGSGVGSIIEPIVAVPLNDEFQQARVLVARAEEDVLSRLTDKMLAELDDIQNLLHTIIRLDVITARAKYSVAYNGAFPDLYLPSDKGGVSITESNFSPNETFSKVSLSHRPPREWKLYMPKAYHPLLLQQHHDYLRRAKKDVANATAEIRRRKLQVKNITKEDEIDSHLASMKLQVIELEKNHPIPVDFMISAKTGVLVITGPNTGGKTISLKTVGLASLMAKTGLYVIASEPVKISWFDAIFADIGDEQSLTQSLSTFSGHLKQIGVIRSQSTRKSLVLLDEVGAGTNPLEGAALGMSLLESFAETSFLTIATTHHGELKALKYSNNAFENACVEFDEESLKPTYKILWGIPGRSNAVNIAERLGLPIDVLDRARKLHGTARAEINEVIVDMERFKHNFQQHLQEAQHYLMLSRKLQESLFMAKQKVADHVAIQEKRKVKVISENAATARSILRKKLHEVREFAMTEKTPENGEAESSRHSIENVKQSSLPTIPTERIRLSDTTLVHEKKIKIPSIGDAVHVPSLGKHAIVLKVEASKKEILVQTSNIKLRLKLGDIETQQV